MSTTQTILITGSTAGIGRYAALHLAQAGHRVIATGRNPEALASLVAEGGERIDHRGASRSAIHGVLLDVTDQASIVAAAAQVQQLTGEQGLDVLINNAGYGQPGAMIDLSEQDLRRQFETNVFGLMGVTKALLPALRRSRRGKILNVSSVGGRITFPLFGAYHASKYAVEALSDALRVELRPLGIGVALIEPGPIRSRFADRAMEGIVSYRGDQASPYAAAYEQAGRVQAMADAQAFGPEVVLRAMEHAIAARRPRARYVVPRRLGLVIGAARLLPTRLLDWVMARFMGLGALRAAAPLAVVLGLLALQAGPAQAAPAPAAQRGAWELVRSDDGILVHRRPVAGSNLHEFRGVGVVEAPIATVLAVLNDAEHRKEWMKEAVANTRIEWSGPYSEIFYSRTGAPWPVADRDVVNQARTSFDSGAHVVRVEFTSVTHPAWPQQRGVVRMPSLRGHWYMWPERGGAWTRIEYQLHADPGGMLPGWVVNMVSKKLPHDTILGIRQQVRRRHYPEFEQQISATPEYRGVLGLADRTAARE